MNQIVRGNEMNQIVRGHEMNQLVGNYLKKQARRTLEKGLTMRRLLSKKGKRERIRV